MADITSLLPPSLNLPPHLSAHKYFFVCTLTVAAWDTLVLSPRAWRLMKTSEWPVLKIIFHFLRFFMPIEFIIVGMHGFVPLLAIYAGGLTQIICFQRSLSSTLSGRRM